MTTSPLNTVRGATPVAAPAAPAKIDFSGVTASKDGQLTYTVKGGDTLSGIASHTGSDVPSLVEINSIQDANKISVGQQVHLPTTFHTVKPGDTYWGLGKQYGVDHKLLMKLNNASPDGALKVGQELIVPSINATPEAKATQTQLNALVKDKAAAEGKLFFGEGTFRTHPMGHAIATEGPVESGQYFKFSDDFKTLQISDNSEKTQVAHLADPVADTKRILAADLMGSVAHVYADNLRKQFPHTQIAVHGPQVGKDGTVKFVVSGPTEFNALDATFNPKTGTVAFFHDGKGDTTTAKAGTLVELTSAMAANCKLKLPLYA